MKIKFNSWHPQSNDNGGFYWYINLIPSIQLWYLNDFDTKHYQMNLSWLFFELTFENRK